MRKQVIRLFPPSENPPFGPWCVVELGTGLPRVSGQALAEVDTSLSVHGLAAMHTQTGNTGADLGAVNTFARACARITEAAWFQRAVIGLIAFAGLLVGAETHRPWLEAYGTVFHVLDRVVLALFLVELGLRIGAHGARPWRFFMDPWNAFDAVIVAVCLLPFRTEFAAVLRLVRVLRVLRLVTALPRLQLLVGALIKSVPSMSYVALLLSLLFYVYAVAGVAVFGEGDPARFGTLPDAGMTLFQVITMEAWVEIMQDQYVAYPSRILPATFFISFILLGTMIILNLFIGVIVNGMDEARQDMVGEERATHLATTGETTLGDDVEALRAQLAAMQVGLVALERRLKAKE